MPHYDKALLLNELGDLTLWPNKSDVVIDVFHTLDSTSDYLKRTAMPACRYHLCLAETQQKGRGSKGRHWHSPDCENIYLSIKSATSLSWDSLSGLSLVVGLSVAKTLSALGLPIKPTVKWPNDVYVKDKKIAGILIDILSTHSQPSDLIIGIGINVHMKHTQEHFSQPWISLCAVHPNPPRREVIIGQLIKTLHDDLNLFNAQGFEAFRANWALHDALAQKQIEIQHPPPKRIVTVLGVDQKGCLLIEEEGKIHAMTALDFTVIA